MFYLTFNDYPSGIFRGQVTDVCHHLNKEFNAGIRLVSFISLRNFSKNKKLIKAQFPEAMVLPMFPGRANWKRNSLIFRIVCHIHKPHAVIARGVFAACMALDAKRSKSAIKVCYDVRAAGVAEFSEYGINPSLLNELKKMEKRALHEADMRMAVSSHLVEYWKRDFEYTSTAHVVIPCTLPSGVPLGDTNALTDEQKLSIRKSIGFGADDLILAYAGSDAGWQSLELLTQFAELQFHSDPRIKLLMLCKENEKLRSFAAKHPGRVVIKWVQVQEVKEFLSACDYGLLIRHASITNSVASPVKFAEYLQCGLPVFITKGIGDFPDFVAKHQCGRVVDPNHFTILPLSKPDVHQHDLCKKLATDYFMKSVYKKEYAEVLEKLM